MRVRDRGDCAQTWLPTTAPSSCPSERFVRRARGFGRIERKWESHKREPRPAVSAPGFHFPTSLLSTSPSAAQVTLSLYPRLRRQPPGAASCLSLAALLLNSRLGRWFWARGCRHP